MNEHFDMGIARSGTYGTIGKATPHVSRLKRNGSALLWSPSMSECL